MSRPKISMDAKNIRILQLLCPESMYVFGGSNPTQRELGKAAGMSGPSALKRIEYLAFHGLATKPYGKSRSMLITPDGRKYLEDHGALPVLAPSPPPA